MTSALRYSLSVSYAASPPSTARAICVIMAEITVYLVQKVQPHFHICIDIKAGLAYFHLGSVIFLVLFPYLGRFRISSYYGIIRSSAYEQTAWYVSTITRLLNMSKVENFSRRCAPRLPVPEPNRHHHRTGDSRRRAPGFPPHLNYDNCLKNGLVARHIGRTIRAVREV